MSWFLQFAFIVITLHDAVRSAELYQSDLLRELLKNYDHNGLPRPLNDQCPMELKLTFSLNAIYELNEKQQVLTGNAWIRMEWYDKMLVWNNTDRFVDVRTLVIDASRIWTPDLAITNSADSLYGEILDKSQFKAEIWPDGRTVQWTGGTFKTSCLLDMTYFPFDSQICSIFVEGWSMGLEYVQLDNSTIALLMDEYRVNGQYDVYDSGSELYKEDYGGAKYQKIKFNLYLRRKPRFMVMTIVLPSVLYTLMMVLVFYLPAESGEKISLSITMMLSFSVFRVMLVDYMPNTSDFIPLMGIYLTCSMILSGLSLFMTVVVLNVRHKDPSHKPNFVICKLLQHTSKYLGLGDIHNKYRTRNSKKVTNLNQKNPAGTEEVISSEFSKQLTFKRNETEMTPGRGTEVATEQEGVICKEIWMDLAKVLDRLLLYLFLMISLLLSVVLLWVNLSLAKKRV